MTPDERAAGLSTADLGEWPKVPADPDPMPDHEDAISSEWALALAFGGYAVLAAIVALGVAGLLSGGAL